ncbi:hypothetical protein JHK82_027535 [Glycine max]|nr:hypothetical protein JHK87_027428 [Glycine soja]KAG4996753.1 hypothetical protein JHK85_028192 [Glycine max]KAG5003523.1 hypothetical protein JHK86_027662 [Glycine max]KAG5126700.1 hypothetical protein JHK82_027535 [Glycine max]KAG5151317.1 hypothetical protein JHK84_027789 [Glycine max]
MENLRDSLIQCVNSKVANFGPHRMPKATRIAQRNKKTNKPSSANLEEIPEWLSTLICLKQLPIQGCPKLLLLPQNMHHLTNLETLEIVGCPELCKKYQKEVGQDWHKTSQIKNVIIDEPEEQRQFYDNSQKLKGELEYIGTTTSQSKF